MSDPKQARVLLKAAERDVSTLRGMGDTAVLIELAPELLEYRRLPAAQPPKTWSAAALALFSGFGEVGDDDAALGKLGEYARSSAHGLDVGAKVGDVHVME